MEQKGVRCPAEDTDEVILPGLDGLFGQVALMFAGWDELVGYGVAWISTLKASKVLLSSTWWGQ